MPKRCWTPAKQAVAAVSASAVAAPAVFIAPPASAVVTYVNPTTAVRQQTAPTDPQQLAAWNLQSNLINGDGDRYLGTPVSERHFLSAQHFGGGNLNLTFNNGEGSFRTTAFWNDPESDLKLYRVDKPITNYADLHRTQDEAGKFLTVFGRGAEVGAPVALNGQNKGWEFGTTLGDDKSWGTNTVDGFSSTNNNLLLFDFDDTNGQSHLSLGDSGGGVFLPNDQGDLVLSAINFGTSGPYTPIGGGTTISATLYDAGGFSISNGAGGQIPLNDTFLDIPGASFSTRVSTRLDWLYPLLVDDRPDFFRGDTDFDSDVDGVDFNNFAIGFGITSGAAWSDGDFDGDGDVDGVDFNALAIEFGNVGVAAELVNAELAALGKSQRVTATVPEPATAGLLTLAGTTLLARRRRRPA